MRTEGFSGHIRKFDPKKIIKPERKNDFDTFFLILGLAYNDLKSLLFYLIQYKKYFKDKNITDISCDAGESGGMKNHLERLITSTVYEIFILIKKQSRVIESSEFNGLLSRLNADSKKIWDQLIDVANKKNLTQTGAVFIRILEDIRNNGSFHYYNSGGQLRNGFANHFFSRQDEGEANKSAFYSRGDRMVDTRYFYCDAAIAGFHKNYIAGKTNPEEYHKAFQKTIESINIGIMNLMKGYLARRI